jgi:hypothetical protein
MILNEFITEAEHYLSETVEEVNDILEEDYPTIFKALPKEAKRALAKMYWIGPNSIAYPITKDQVTRAPFTKGLCVFLDAQYQPFAYTLGADIKLLKRWTGSGTINRAKAKEAATQIFYISPDPETKETLEFRADAPKVVGPVQQSALMILKRWEDVQKIIEKKIADAKSGGKTNKDQLKADLTRAFELVWARVHAQDSHFPDVRDIWINSIASSQSYQAATATSSITSRVRDIEYYWNEAKSGMISSMESWKLNPAKRDEYAQYIATHWKLAMRVVDNLNRILKGQRTRDWYD